MCLKIMIEGVTTVRCSTYMNGSAAAESGSNGPDPVHTPPAREFERLRTSALHRSGHLATGDASSSARLSTMAVHAGRGASSCPERHGQAPCLPTYSRRTRRTSSCRVILGARGLHDGAWKLPCTGAIRQVDERTTRRWAFFQTREDLRTKMRRQPARTLPAEYSCPSSL
jgi:hypothetical protein